jgi:hypothetical protein
MGDRAGPDAAGIMLDDDRPGGRFVIAANKKSEAALKSVREVRAVSDTLVSRSPVARTLSGACFALVVACDRKGISPCVLLRRSR